MPKHLGRCLLLSIGLGACGHAASTGPFFARPTHVPARAACFRSDGRIFPPLDTTAVVGGRTPTWLVLFPAAARASGTAYTVWLDGRGQVGGWKRPSQDSVVVFLYDGFTSSELVLRMDSTGLTGRGTGNSDEVVMDSAGVGRMVEYSWYAAAVRASCSEVPRAVTSP
jgi:hypothetical protein